MDNQFTTLTKSYYDNFLQYRLTGNASYQNSYMSAEQGIEAILASLQDQVNTQNQQISNFYSSDVEGKLKTIQSDIRSAQRNILSNSDEAVAATMRNTSVSQPISSGVPTSYMIATGALAATYVLLSLLQ